MPGDSSAFLTSSVSCAVSAKLGYVDTTVMFSRAAPVRAPLGGASVSVIVPVAPSATSMSAVESSAHSAAGPDSSTVKVSDPFPVLRKVMVTSSLLPWVTFAEVWESVAVTPFTTTLTVALAPAEVLPSCEVTRMSRS